jgi:integrase
MIISKPVSGITRQMKADSHRDVYVKDETFSLVKQFAKEYLQDAMDLAFLTGQRPVDVFKAQWSDIKDGTLVFVQNKTHQVVQVLISEKLEKIVRQIKSRGIIGKTIICRERRQAITYDKFRDDLRAKVASDSKLHDDA